ncbi:DUF4153 domain-containing protein [Cellulomonas cellasea]|uniref:DUF4173 domain-containing protein n=1 Tax=Cellulomonas cellasea TaxID=43670 RepID=A0A7W4UJA9_9CELL|nr:DUF4173 domain-containing protein [Cellulomonas cellasea]MBB2924710.1 hypothetical protein [Cellulomonas cellasea]
MTDAGPPATPTPPEPEGHEPDAAGTPRSGAPGAPARGTPAAGAAAPTPGATSDAPGRPTTPAPGPATAPAGPAAPGTTTAPPPAATAPGGARAYAAPTGGGVATAAPPTTWPAPTYLPPPLPPTRFTLARDEFWAARALPAPAPVLAACAGVGALGGLLLVGHPLGLGAALVGLAVWGAAAPTLVRRRAWGALVTAALAVALVAMVAVRDAAWVVALCLTVAAVAGAVAATSARSAPAVASSLLSWGAGALRALPWVRHGVGALVGTRRAELLVALRSVAVTVVLLVVFGALFASADTVFASYLPRFGVGLLPAQLAVGTLVALVAATLAHLALAPPAWSDHRLPEGRPARRGEWLLPVVALGTLVLAFVLVQVGALVDGHRHVLDTLGLSYAEYARQGFAQLVAVTALTLVVVGLAARRAPRETSQDRLVSRVALGFLCLGSLGVVASALRRMDLYVETFGLTRLRLLVLVGEIVLAVLLVLVMAAGVRWRGTWLPRAAVQVVAVAMLALALANPDAQIVRHNTTEEAREQLDVLYLRGLSADAVPALDALDEPLRSCVLDGRVVVAPEGLGDANLSRSRAVAVLADGAPVDSDGGSACTSAYRGSR